jgi:uncharacterized membrane protein
VTRRVSLVLLGLVAAMTLGGYLLKAQCIGHYNERRDANLCSNDIQVLYVIRDMQHHPFPYVHGDLADGQLVGGALEYPVLTGLFAWVPAVFVSDDGSYLRLTALLLSPFSFLTVWLLARMVRWRALLYALAPPLVWYSFHNWDLLVVCATVGAFYAWWRGRYGWAGVWLAVGASLKFWPVFLVLPLVLERLAARDRDGAVASGGGFVGVAVAVNGWFAVQGPQGWWAPYAFQKERAADITSNSIWFWGFPSLTTDELNRLIPVLLVLGTAVACLYGWRRARVAGAYPFVQVSGALLCLFVVTGKAHSPQYALWLLPFFCLVQVRWGWWASYMAVDALMYVGLFRWYADLAHGKDFGVAKQALVLGVWGRAALLVLLFVVFLRSETAFELRRPRPPVPDLGSGSTADVGLEELGGEGDAHGVGVVQVQQQGQRDTGT